MPSRPADESLFVSDLRGGRNDGLSPFALPDTQCQEAMNVDWYESLLGSKRLGSTAIGVTGGTAFAGLIGSLIRHVPGFDETQQELWACDATGVIKRLTGGTSWANVTGPDAPSSSLDWDGVSLGGFFHVMYDTTQNRSHVWDASLSKLRRSGLATPAAAPTGADDGAGGLSLTRSYRVRWVDVSGSDTRRLSEASAVLTRTIAAKAGSTITRPTAASEDETHWDLEASDTTTGPWYRIARTAIATTTFDDTSATIATTNPSPEDGINYPPPSAKYVRKINSRLVMAGNYETTGGYVTPKNNRVWWTPVIGANDIGDLERIPSGYYLDTSAPITGLSFPLFGSIYVFGYRNIWKLVPTGLPGANAFQLLDVNNSLGCIRHQSIAMGVDENGRECVYFLSAQGPYRIGSAGLQYLGSDNETLWSTFNPDATVVTCHSVYHTEKHQWWVWIAVSGTGNDPSVKLVFDPELGVPDGERVRFGWSRGDGQQARARCSCMFSGTIAASMGRALKPYIGQWDANAAIWKCDDPTSTNDAGTNFQAYLTTKDYILAGLGDGAEIVERFLLARVQSGVTITCTIVRDNDATTAGFSTTSTVSLTATGSETRVRRKFESGELSEGTIYRFTIGDSAAVSNVWALDAFLAKWRAKEPK